LTAEEQEEEEVTASKQEIRFIKQQDVASTRNAYRIAAMAEETARQTMARLGSQGESIHNTERNLDLASNQNRLAAEKARELKTLNRSMFAVHVANPFTSSKRIREHEEKVLSDNQRDREERDALRQQAWDTNSRQQKLVGDIGKGGLLKPKANLAERAKYQFEAVSYL
jgi:protein transport protein SEC9